MFLTSTLVSFLERLFHDAGSGLSGRVELIVILVHSVDDASYLSITHVDPPITEVLAYFLCEPTGFRLRSDLAFTLPGLTYLLKGYCRTSPSLMDAESYRAPVKCCMHSLGHYASLGSGVACTLLVTGSASPFFLSALS